MNFIDITFVTIGCRWKISQLPTLTGWVRIPSTADPLALVIVDEVSTLLVNGKPLAALSASIKFTHGYYNAGLL